MNQWSVNKYWSNIAESTPFNISINDFAFKHRIQKQETREAKLENFRNARKFQVISITFLSNWKSSADSYRKNETSSSMFPFLKSGSFEWRKLNDYLSLTFDATAGERLFNGQPFDVCGRPGGEKVIYSLQFMSKGHLIVLYTGLAISYTWKTLNIFFRIFR